VEAPGFVVSRSFVGFGAQLLHGPGPASHRSHLDHEMAKIRDWAIVALIVAHRRKERCERA
jgi:hypothetical protein